MCGHYKLTVPFREIVRLYNLTNSINLSATDRIVPSLSAKGLADAPTKATVMMPSLGHMGIVVARDAPNAVRPKLSTRVRARG